MTINSNAITLVNQFIQAENNAYGANPFFSDLLNRLTAPTLAASVPGKTAVFYSGSNSLGVSNETTAIQWAAQNWTGFHSRYLGV